MMLNENLAEECILKQQTLEVILKDFLGDMEISYRRESEHRVRIDIGGTLKTRYSDDLGCLIATEDEAWEWKDNRATGSIYMRGVPQGTVLLSVTETFPGSTDQPFCASIEIIGE